MRRGNSGGHTNTPVRNIVAIVKRIIRSLFFFGRGRDEILIVVWVHSGVAVKYFQLLEHGAGFSKMAYVEKRTARDQGREITRSRLGWFRNGEAWSNKDTLFAQGEAHS